MKFSASRIIAAILAVLFLACLAACRNLPPPKRGQAAPSPYVTQQEPGAPAADSSAGALDGAGSGAAGAQGTSESPGAADAAGTPETPEPTPALQPVAVRRIYVDLGAKEIARGTLVELKVVVYPADATDKAYTLSSSDEDVLREADGQWLAVGGGRADLIATAANGVRGKAAVTVVVPVESISLDKQKLTIARGEKIQLTPTYSPDDATGMQAQYSSDDRGVATVGADGTVHAVGAGKTSIRCAVGDVSASCDVTVVVPVTAITVSTGSRTYKTGDKASITVEIAPDDATDKKYTVKVDGSAASLAGDGAVSCDAGGEATITATAANGVSGSRTITIVDMAAFADEVFRLTNVERARAGLPAFTSAAPLTKAAAVRANEIISSFSHDRPDGRSCFSAFEESGVTYSMAGENIAMGQRTPDEAVRGWMNSPSHRAAILEAGYGRLGVGVAMDEGGRLHWAQAFAD